MAFGLFGPKPKKADPEREKEFSEMMEREKVGFRDGFAMLLAAFLTIVLPCLLVLGGLAALILLLFGAFH